MAQNNHGGREHGPPSTSHGFNQLKFGSGVEEARRQGMDSPLVIESDPPLMFTHGSKSRRHEKRIKGRKWVGGGPGMQAVFLGLGPSSSGTGVFLPRGDGPDPKSTKIKLPLSPVLLPSHIVQALNLNVGQQISKPRLTTDETKNCVNRNEEKLEKTPKGYDLCLYPEIINLPEEWTY